jgi:hypothetical protein
MVVVHCRLGSRDLGKGRCMQSLELCQRKSSQTAGRARKTTKVVYDLTHDLFHDEVQPIARIETSPKRSRHIESRNIENSKTCGMATTALNSQSTIGDFGRTPSDPGPCNWASRRPREQDSSDEDSYIVNDQNQQALELARTQHDSPNQNHDYQNGAEASSNSFTNTVIDGSERGLRISSIMSLAGVTPTEEQVNELIGLG